MTKAASPHATLRTGLAWLERVIPDQVQGTEDTLAALQLCEAVLTTGRAVETLSNGPGYWRECMTLARSALEMTLTAMLLGYEPGRYADYREHGREVLSRLREGSERKPPQPWFRPKTQGGKKGFAGVVEAVEQYAPQLSEVIKHTYHPACSFAHSDFLSLMVTEKDLQEYVLRWGCRIMGIAAYLAAQLVDLRWNDGRLVDQILEDQDHSLDEDSA